MNYKKVSTLLKTINLEIEELKADLETKGIPDSLTPAKLRTHFM